MLSTKQLRRIRTGIFPIGAIPLCAPEIMRPYYRFQALKNTCGTPMSGPLLFWLPCQVITKVTATNSRGCNKTKTITVKEYPLPEEFTIQSSVSKINPQQSSVVMSVAPQPGLSYTWDMGDGATENGTSVSHTYHVTGDIKSYSIKVTAQNEGGCQRSASTHIEVVPFMIPNVFSPNGDGINDIFMPDVELEIFDRNGLVLYRGSTGWDGNFRGRQMAPDTYFYIFHYQDSDEKQQVRKGYVMLVR